MHFLNYFFAPKQDLINAGLRSYLNITSRNKEMVQDAFKYKNPDISSESISKNFMEYRKLYQFAETTLVNLYKLQVDRKDIKKEFFGIILKKYSWVDNSNMKKLYDTCNFYLK